MLNNRQWGIAIALVSAFLVTLGLTSPAATAQTARSSNDVSFEDQFWKYLVGNNYKNWSPGFSDSADFYLGDNPHGPYLKAYVNRTAAGSIDDLAVGSVVILENYRRDRSLRTISVMYRTAGFNPDANDWYWIEYRPDGSVIGPEANASQRQSGIHNVSLTASTNRTVMGKASNCIGCHQSASGNDFVFSNDQFAQQRESVAKRGVAKKSVAKGGVVANKESEEGSDKFDYVADADADDFFGSR